MTRAIRPLSFFFAEIGDQTLSKNRTDGLNGVTFVSFLSQLFYLTSEMGAKMTSDGKDHS